MKDQKNAPAYLLTIAVMWRLLSEGTSWAANQRSSSLASVAKTRLRWRWKEGEVAVLPTAHHVTAVRFLQSGSACMAQSEPRFPASCVSYISFLSNHRSSHCLPPRKAEGIFLLSSSWCMIAPKMRKLKFKHGFFLHILEMNIAQFYQGNRYVTMHFTLYCYQYLLNVFLCNEMIIKFQFFKKNFLMQKQFYGLGK